MQGQRTTFCGCVVLLCVAGCAGAHGYVFVDRNHNGVRDGGERGLPGVVVALDRSRFAVTGAGGAFALDAASPGTIVWARSPDGFRPGPAWAPAAPDGLVEVPLEPLDDAPTGPPSFVVAADSHTTANPADPWDGGDLDDALDQATALANPPRFFTIVGDITQGGTAAELARVADAIGGIAVPFVPVPGNHDWLDGGAAYRSVFGPDNYSFDVGTLHVVVWDTNLPASEQIQFFVDDLSHVHAPMTVVALGHASPPDEVADALAELGVEYVFTGHWHANRRIEHGGLVEWGTQTFVMGGIDQAPSGYRIVTFDGDVPTIVGRERLIAPHLETVAPDPHSCTPPGPLAIIAAAALDGNRPRVTARVDCGEPFELSPAGGWDLRGNGPALAPGTHTLDLEATSPSGRSASTHVGFEVCAAPPAPVPTTTWPQLGGGPQHTGATAATLEPPLQVAWTTTVGGPLELGTPIVAGDLAIVSQTDRDGGDRGGLIALEVANGRERWRTVTPSPATAAAAVGDGMVIATLGDGEVIAVDLADGAIRWRHDLTVGLSRLASSEWAPPLVDGAAVYAGVPGRFTALDLATGASKWLADRHPLDPWLGSLAAPAAAGDTILAAFDRDTGLAAYDAATGAPRWELRATETTAIQAAPVIGDGTAYICSAYGDVSAVDVTTGRLRWTRRLTEGGFDWGYSITAAPAYADGRLFVPTQWNAFVALDAATGAELWRTTTPLGPLELAHYRSAEPGFAASPLVTGDVVWIGRPDGTLAALSAADGRELWSIPLGSPVLSAPAPSGNALIVATYDGTVRALVPAAAVIAGDPIACQAPLPGGCCDAGSPPGASALVVACVLCRRRRRARGTMRR